MVMHLITVINHHMPIIELNADTFTRCATEHSEQENYVTFGSMFRVCPLGDAARLGRCST